VLLYAMPGARRGGGGHGNDDGPAELESCGGTFAVEPAQT